MTSSKQSKYALRMLKLSGKIFSEYIRPQMPHEISRAVLVDGKQRTQWESYHYQNEQIVERSKERPADLLPTRNPHYYPAHPQLKDLISTLREHGLFRDEHQDIVEEMSRLRALRGKPDKVRKTKGNKYKPESETKTEDEVKE
ncbi:hypothetical protein RDWZM_005718 [Blomia tropicalis]|uniref:Small ribosomal subunit protein mS33 n=1 Tax=Blomia tropicalis TaxID=40697 RepID=A0A9Q0RMN7_BLOTA|nr:hypothetical protein RDWZM_005718 [Blomia tropicalis]